MVADKILAAVRKYDERLKHYEAERLPSAVYQPTRKAALGHARWMCQEVQTFVANGLLEKAERWIGFIQGVLWAAGEGTIDEFREDNR